MEKCKIWIGNMSEADKALAFKAVQKIDDFYSNKSLSENKYTGFFIEGSEITNLTRLEDKSYHYDDDEESTEITLQQLLKLADMEENMTTKHFTKSDLVAGKHVVERKDGDRYFIISTEVGLSGLNLDGTSHYGNFDNYSEALIFDGYSDADIVKVYTLTHSTIFSNLRENLELVWERTPPKTEAQIQLEKLQQQITELQAQADKLKATL